MAKILASAAVLRNYFTETWKWDAASASEDVLLSDNKRLACFHVDPVKESTGTAGVRGDKGFSDGQHYWEVTMETPPWGYSVIVGVGTAKAKLHLDNYKYEDLIGMDSHSWGLSYKGHICHNGQSRKYCDPFYDRGTIIGIHLDLYRGTLTFFKNGECLGVAFEGLNQVTGDLYPMSSSTSPETEVELGIQTCHYLSLQEKCCLTVIRHLQSKDSIDTLPLPSCIKETIMEL